MRSYQLTRYLHDRPETDWPEFHMHSADEAIAAAAVSIAAEYADGIADGVTYTLRLVDDAETEVARFSADGSTIDPEHYTEEADETDFECEACGEYCAGPCETADLIGENLCHECAPRFDADYARSHGPNAEIARIRANREARR